MLWLALTTRMNVSIQSTPVKGRNPFTMHQITMYQIILYTPNISQFYSSIQFSSVQSLSRVWLSAGTMDCSTPGLPVHHQLPELVQTHVHQVGDAIQPSHPLPCCPLLLLPSIFPSIRVFSMESVICIRWPKFWSFSFSLSPSNEYSGLISSRIDWFDLFDVQGILKSLLQHQVQMH